MTAAHSPVFEAEPQLLGAMLDVCEALVLVLRADGTVAYANRTAQAVLGAPSKQPIWALPADDLEAERRCFEALLAGQYPAARQNTWVTPDRGERRISWHYNCLADADGVVQWVVGTGIDVTETLRATNATEDSQAHLRAVLDTAVDAIITIDPKGIVKSFNLAAERMFGYTAAEVIEQNVKMLMHGEHHKRHDDYIAHYLATGEARIIGVGREVDGRRADGSRFPLELAVSEVHFDDHVHFTGILRDLSERRAAEHRERQRLDELAHASRLSAMGEMSSGIAHELNQPLAAIVTFAEACQRLAEADRLDADTLRDSLAQIAAQGQRAGTIVGRLRRMARKDPGERAPVDINSTVRDVLTLLTHDLRLREVQLDTTLAADAPMVVADRVQIEQVVLNLVRNALDAMEAVPTADRLLHINTRTVPGGIQVEVLDSGTGLPLDDPDAVFDSFFTTKANGVGLGLSISRSIIEAHGGRLQAQNRPGGGARFLFSLPGQST